MSVSHDDMCFAFVYESVLRCVRTIRVRMLQVCEVGTDVSLIPMFSAFCAMGMCDSGKIQSATIFSFIEERLAAG